MSKLADEAEDYMSFTGGSPTMEVCRNLCQEIRDLEAEIDTLDATVTESALADFQLRCAPGDLDAWLEAANDSNMSLNAWINWKVNL